MKHLILLIIGWMLAGPVFAEPIDLNEAVQEALLNNAQVMEAQGSEKSAQEGVKSSRAEFLPKVSAAYSYSRLGDEPYQKSGGVQIVAGDRDNYHWDVTVVQPLFTGFALTSQHTVSKADADIGSLSLERTVQDVVRDAKSAYFQVLLAEQIRKVAEDKVKTLESQVKDAHSFFNHGIIPKNDLLKSNIALAAAIQEREKAWADVHVARSRLAIIMGKTLDAELTLTPVETGITVCEPLEDLYAEALKNRPELLILDQELKKVETSVKLTRGAYYPDVALVGQYEQNGNNPSATDNDFTNDHNTTVSVQATWTFFEWGKKRADTAGAQYDLRAFKQRIRAARDQVKLEVKQEVLDLGVREKNIKTAQEALEQARENFRITKSQYLQHVTTATEVLDAQTYLSSAESDYYKALYGYKIARARLDRAVGRKVD